MVAIPAGRANKGSTLTERRIEEIGCLLCGAELGHEKGSAYSVCFDEPWIRNHWGGETHEYIGYLCDACGKRLQEVSSRRLRGEGSP